MMYLSPLISDHIKTDPVRPIWLPLVICIRPGIKKITAVFISISPKKFNWIMSRVMYNIFVMKEYAVPYINDKITKLSKQKMCEIEIHAYFISVGSNSIVSYFDSKICSQVAVPQSQITTRA